MQNGQDSLHQKVMSAVDSGATYCTGGGLAWLSCTADRINPILQAVGVLVGILIALAKGYYDWTKHKRKMGRPVNDR